MGWPQYTPSGYPRRKKPGSSQFMRSEFELIEEGIDRLDLMILQADFDMPATTFTYRYFVVPYDCTVTRCGLVVHHPLASGSNLSVLWEDSNGDEIGLRVSASNQIGISEALQPEPGARVWRRTEAPNEFSEGDYIRARGYSSVGAQRWQSVIEIARRA